MIETVILHRSGGSLAVILKNYLLEKMCLKEGSTVEVFFNPVDSKKRVFGDQDIFHIKIRSVSQSMGFYVPLKAIKDLGLKPGNLVEIVFSKVVKK